MIKKKVLLVRNFNLLTVIIKWFQLCLWAYKSVLSNTRLLLRNFFRIKIEPSVTLMIYEAFKVNNLV